MRLAAFSIVAALLLGAAWSSSAQAQPQAEAELDEMQLEEQVRQFGGFRDDQEKLRRGREMLRRHYLSSQQVKTIAMRFTDEPARLEFALAAYPRVVDPENFYEVYDAFKTFSKVMRLHDFVRGSRGPGWPAPPPAPVAVTDEEVREMTRALKSESFDKTRIRLAKQMLSTSRRPFLATHVRQLVECFDFEPSKLEVAKYAWDYTLDREKYFLINPAFAFENSKENLAEYIRSRPQGRPPSTKGP